jgi:hypothetical protein
MPYRTAAPRERTQLEEAERNYARAHTALINAEKSFKEQTITFADYLRIQGVYCRARGVWRQQIAALPFARHAEAFEALTREKNGELHG